MFIEREARREAEGLSDLIDYFALVSDGVVVTHSGVYITAWEFAGRDMDALPLAECYAIANRLKDNLRLGAGWSIQCDLIRSEYTEYAPANDAWPEPVSKMVEEERSYRFNLTGTQAATRLSRCYFCLSYEASAAQVAARKLMGLNDETPLAGVDADLDRFHKKVEEFQAALWVSVRSVRRLKGYFKHVGLTMQHCCELCEYLRETISGERYAFAVPHTPVDLYQHFAVNDLGYVQHEKRDESGKRVRAGVRGLELGDPLNELLPGKCVRVLAVDSFPEDSFAGILRELDLVPFTFRFTQQAVILDDVTASKIHKDNKGKWKFRGTGGLKGQVKGPTNDDLDIESLKLAADAGQAKSAAEHGRETYCRYMGKIILMDSDVTALVEASRVLAQRLRHCGFSCRIETVNAVAAWLGSMPGQHYKDSRASIITTENLAHMMPLSQPFMGHLYNPSPLFPDKSPPLFYGLTAGSAPYRFNCHVEDVGHTICVGPSGSGKTTVVGLGMVQALRYPGSQVFAFDKKKSLYTLTKCVGGAFIDLAPGSKTRLCPLAELSTPEDQQWAEQWVSLLVELNNLTVVPAIINDIRLAISKLALSRASRSLNDLYLACTAPELKRALEAYLGSILDGEEDGIQMSRFTVFEMDQLYSLDKRLMNGALFYIFGKIRKRLRSDVPTFLFVDEFRAALSHPLAAKAFSTYLFEGRALNLAVWLVIQELGETLASPLKGAVLEQSFTKICLPNPQASLEARLNYESLGCNRADMMAIAGGVPKQDYYVMQPSGNRLISLELGPVVLALLKSGDKDREALDALIQQLGRQRAVEAWFRRHNLHDWADYYQVLAGIGPNAATEAADYAHS
jgi:type IV secretion/conjugal transfer VirB4 family ATPase